MCPWYFTLKGLISERPNLVPVGLGNNTAKYDRSILLRKQGTDGTGPNQTADDLLDSKELGEPVEDQEHENDLTDAPSPDIKVTTGENKVPVKKERSIPAKQSRSQVDRIADAEMARLDCKKAKLEVEQERLKSIKSIAVAKAQEKTHRTVEVRQAELNIEREKMRMDHDYRMEMLKLGRILPPSPNATSLHGFQPYQTAWNFLSPLPSSQSSAIPPPSTPSEETPLEDPLCSSLEESSGGDHQNGLQMKSNSSNGGGC